MTDLDEGVGVRENNWVVKSIRFFNTWRRQGFV